ncbi:MAG: reprolysin-like metallopeptidase [Flavobacterium sp.]|uniref:zinc-dependent metalloprotease n=1 Tax=Flavobacterium sp. TaxID=239 RepID=UPI0032649AC4
MKKFLLLIVLSFSFGQLVAQNTSLWHAKEASGISELKRIRTNNICEGELYFGLDLNGFKQSLVTANDKFSNMPGVAISIPNLDGELETFLVWENSNFDPQLQARFPEIRSYVGKGLTDKSATLNLSISPQGIQTLVFRADTGTEFIEAYDNQATTYVLFNSNKRVSGRLPFTCSTNDVALTNEVSDKVGNTTLADNAKYKTFRLALSCTAEYANYFGATSNANVGLVLAAMNATLTRVNGVMEKDLAVHLNLIATTDQVIYYNSASDPYSNATIGTDPDNAGNSLGWNSQVQSTLTSVLGDGAYDIGHLFGASGGGGNAGCIGCVCVDGSKGSGYTSPSNNVPQGDNFDIDFVVHELGHQLGAFHTFTYNYEASGVQVEPGSGSSIMAYAGVATITATNTLAYNVQAHSDALFCYKSINQIQANLALSGASCAVTTVLTGINATPTAVGGGSFTIPISTPFKLTGIGTDADGDVLTYSWEQNNAGTAATTQANSRVFGTKTTGPNFRIFPASSSPSRYFPQMSKILVGTIVIATGSDANWESCSSVARTLNFTVTVRDNHPGMGQTKAAAAAVTVVSTAGPFAVTSQTATGISYAGGSTQTVTWNVLNSDTLTGGAMVDILLSTNVNGNNTTFDTVLASGIPNNGSATVTIPNLPIASSTCRFMVRASANVFFALNSRNFTILSSLGTEEFGLQNLVLYPNPNKGSFNVKFDSNSGNDINISVFDIRGRAIYSKNFANSGVFDQNLNMEDIQSGVYLLTVTDGKMKQTKKIMVE